MICKLHLSKVLKVSHETKSNLTRNGLVTVIIFKDLNMQAALININPRDNLLIINDAGIEYINKNVDPALVSTGDFEILINNCYTGVKQQDLQAFGIDINTLYVYGYIQDLV